MVDFKNPSIVKEIFDSNQIIYATWLYDEDYDFCFDIILTEKSLNVIGKDVIDTHFFSRIGHCVAFFGDEDENYFYNYWNHDRDWTYGDGEILVFFSDGAGNEYGLSFQQGRFKEAQKFFLKLREMIEKN